MRTSALLVGIAALALCQQTTRTLQFTQLQTPPQLTEAATIIRSIGEIRDLKVDVTARTMTIFGDAGQLALADWLLPRLDRLSNTPAGVAELEHHTGEGDDVTRVFYFKHPATSTNMQQMTTISRALTEIRRAFVSNAAEALVVRGTNEQLEVAGWILGTLDRPSFAAEQGREHHIRDDVGEDTIRVFFLPKFGSPEELQNFASELRMATQVRRVFTYYPLRVILMRSTPEQIAHAARLVNQP